MTYITSIYLYDNGGYHCIINKKGKAIPVTGREGP
jgi:hypothetical protein